MGQPNYKQVEGLLALHEDFKHGYSMSAERRGDEYVVWSYRTVIARYDFTTGAWWLNENKYSVTTSKQQNILRRVIAAQSGRSPLASAGVVFP